MRFFSLAFVSVLCGALWVPAASALPAAGLTTGNSLITFDTATPSTLTAGPTAIAGLGAGETLLDIDVRPANNLLYGLSKDESGTGRIYTINVTTAVATLVATLAADPADLTAPYTNLNGTEFGIDFNPVVDRLRVVSDAGQNLRINVSNGLVTTDTDLNYAPGDANAAATPSVPANAYTNSVAGASATTLYGLNFTNQTLVIQNPPNNGTLNTVGPLFPQYSPFDISDISGFDIAPTGNQAFASLNLLFGPSSSSLGSINLATGETQFVGEGFIGGGAPVRGLALLPPVEKPSFVVNSTDDIADNYDGVTTLREAINYANANPNSSAITFRLPAGAQTISLTSALPDLSTPMIITGPTGSGQGVTIARGEGSIESPVPDFRIFTVGSGVTVGLSNLTIANGRLVSPDGSAEGGGILNYGTQLTLTRCSVINNYVSGSNDSSRGGGILNGLNASYASPSTLILVNSTISGNTVECSAPGYSASGGGISNANGNISILNSTIANNSAIATNGSGVYGGGVESFRGGVTVKNTIVASNIAADTPNIGRSYTNDGGNIIDGDPKLGPLADNGGATPTHALLPGSPAIGIAVRKGTPATDQRGSARDSRPDTGAYEFVNGLPRINAVTPQGASDPVGAKRTFSVTTSDDNGPGDVKSVSLIVNTRLSAAEGATFTYFPSDLSPTSGQLFLSKGDATLPPIIIENGQGSASDTLDNGAVRITGNDVQVSTEGNGFVLSVSATIRDGLFGNNTLFARVEDKSGATDPASAAGDMGYVRFGSYTVTSQFPSEGNSIPTLSKLTPGASYTTLTTSGLAPKAQSFGFFAKDENGLSDIESVIFLAGKQRGWKNSATFLFTPRTRRLYLRSDDGSTFLGGGQIGSTGILENSQVRVDLAQVKFLVYADGKSMGLSLPLQAKRGLLGQNKIWLRVQDNQGAVASGSDDQGYILSGTWEVKATAPRAADPSAGNS